MVIFSNKIYFPLCAQQQQQQQHLHRALLQSRTLPLPFKPPSSLPGRKNQTSLLLHASSPFNTSTSTLPRASLLLFQLQLSKASIHQVRDRLKNLCPAQISRSAVERSSSSVQSSTWDVAASPLAKPAWKQPGWDLLWSWNVPETAPPLYSLPPQSKETYYVKHQVGSFSFYDANI